MTILRTGANAAYSAGWAAAFGSKKSTAKKSTAKKATAKKAVAKKAVATKSTSKKQPAAKAKKKAKK